MHGTNPVAVQLANLLAELAPGDLTTVKFQCGGSEVTEAAIKLARQYHRLTGNPGKYKIISRYHVVARLDDGLAVGVGPEVRARRSTSRSPRASSTSFRRPAIAARSARRIPTAASPAPRSSSDVIEMEDPATVAAVMVEPIGHTGGIIDPPPEYLPILREICDRHNVLLIFDEIITGIGRTGQMFAAETFGVTARRDLHGQGAERRLSRRCRR